MSCPVCFTLYTSESAEKPRVLPCGHDLCTTCLTTMTSARAEIACPKCRAAHTIRDVLSVPTVYALITTPSTVTCDDLEKRECQQCEIAPKAATKFCAECPILLCGTHANAHATQRLTHDHALLPASFSSFWKTNVDKHLTARNRVIQKRLILEQGETLHLAAETHVTTSRKRVADDLANLHQQVDGLMSGAAARVKQAVLEHRTHTVQQADDFIEANTVTAAYTKQSNQSIFDALAESYDFMASAHLPTTAAELRPLLSQLDALSARMDAPVVFSNQLDMPVYTVSKVNSFRFERALNHMVDAQVVRPFSSVPLDSILVVGGTKTFTNPADNNVYSVCLENCEQYEIFTDQWRETRVNLGSGRVDSSLLLLDNHFFAVGGYNFRRPRVRPASSESHIGTIVHLSSEWNAIDSWFPSGHCLPDNSYSLCATTCGGLGVIASMNLLDNRASSLLYMDPTYTTLGSLCELPLKFKRFSLVSLDHTIYTIGGQINDVGVQTVFSYSLGADRMVSDVSLALPVGLVDVKTFVDAGSIYAIGGINMEDNFNRMLYRLDPREGQWASVGVQDSLCSSGSVVAHLSTVFMIGGRDGDIVSNKVTAVDLRINRSMRKADMINGRADHASVVY